MKFLEKLEVTGTETNLAHCANGLIHRSGRPGMAVTVSDLFDEKGFDRGLDQLRYRRFDGHVIQLYDPQEAEPPMLGDVEMVDVENESVRLVTVTEKNIRTYKQLFQNHQQSVQDYCRNHGMGCTQSPATIPFDELVLRMMRKAGQVG